MTYKQRMMLLNLAIYDAIRAGNDERQPVTALREMAADIDHIIDHGAYPVPVLCRVQRGIAAHTGRPRGVL